MENEKIVTPDPASSTAKADFVGTDRFDITLTYGRLKEPIVFPCKILLNADDKAARQAFYALSKGDQERGEFEFDLEFMTRVVVDDPRGLPGYDIGGGNLKTRLTNYFASGEPILRKIANDFGNIYTREVTPVELFR